MLIGRHKHHSVIDFASNRVSTTIGSYSKVSVHTCAYMCCLDGWVGLVTCLRNSLLEQTTRCGGNKPLMQSLGWVGGTEVSFCWIQLAEPRTFLCLEVYRMTFL